MEAATMRGEAAAPIRRTARITGMWYLALAVTGVVGFLLVRPMIHVADDPAATLANLVDRAALARIGVALELGTVAAQALVALWFYKLFRAYNPVGALAIALFGTVNAVVILGSTAFQATALAVAGDAGLAPGGDAAAMVQLLFGMSTAAWEAGALFFGLWLIPMGFVALTSGAMPAWLGRVLVLGGGFYVLSAFSRHGIADTPGWLLDGLTVPAIIGEFWIIGYLLIRGVREPATPPRPA